jgi:hypothetical protein
LHTDARTQIRHFMKSQKAKDTDWFLFHHIGYRYITNSFYKSLYNQF